MRQPKHRQQRAWSRLALAGLAAASFLAAGAVTAFAVSFASTTSNPSNTFSATTVAAPTGLTATGAPTVTLGWTATASTWATGHRVLRATASGGPYTQIAEISPRTTVSYQDTPGVGTYYYVVRGYYGTWESANSNEAGPVGSSCSSPGTQVASADIDAWLSEFKPTQNNGIDLYLDVWADGSTNKRRGVVRFALPAVPSGCTVTAATLNLYAEISTTGRTLHALRLAATWTETGVTWANQPATTGAAAAAASAAGWVQWVVTSQVQSMYSGANNGFLIMDSAETAGRREQRFTSREGPTVANRPKLEITFG